jgi:hypothetical protein
MGREGSEESITALQFFKLSHKMPGINKCMN